MKKWIIIVIAVAILSLLLGVWLYLFFNGSPDSTEDVFSNFQTQNNQPAPDAPMTTDPTEIPDDTSSTEPVLPPLRQLTTTPVAGFTFFTEMTSEQATASSTATSTRTEKVRYAEKGTGHIYELDPATNTSVRLSNRTVANATEVYFSESGTYAAILTESSNDVEIVTLEIATGSSSETTIVGEKSIAGDNFATQGDYLMYTTIEDNQATGNALHLPSQSPQVLFSLPYIDTAVAWGDSINDSHFVYPKPHSDLNSYVYEIAGDQMYRTPVEGKNLSVIYNASLLAYSYQIDNGRDADTRSSFLYDITNQAINQLATPVINEKCSFSSDTRGLWCASSINNSQDMLQEWYRGEHQANDVIWYLDPYNNSSRLVVNISRESGRNVDVDSISTNQQGTTLLFRNRNDGTLWLYEQ